ncbi:uncharacterized protein EI90DRAFT_3146850 [Cantharellus anzutake]|uniref:uncharacterized protein n=1 Tax=Cantharellus anzutake TaxID=1750568 RepID=UPI001907A7D1|nr:uncharacterized protein EI90DRAFT_3146850 [Cantharellus anzutake]KAF8324424.1 hypothetical protein EI90DRAFT_3146850 [Cantharellus anzutake]
MRQRVKEMEEEAQKLRQFTTESEAQSAVRVDPTPAGASNTTQITTSLLAGAEAPNEDSTMEEDPAIVDARSVYVGNVDYGATPEEIQAHFQSCGSINRITILCDKFTGHPKGFAYVEFADPTYVLAALVLNDSTFRGRQIKVTEKRTNLPAFMLRGRGRGRGTYRGGRGYNAPGYSPYYRGRGRGRGRGY